MASLATPVRARKSKKAPADPRPYHPFPLTPHRATNRWSKRIDGKTYYFGPLADWRGALKRLHDLREKLYAGLPVAPAPTPTTLTLWDLCDLYHEAGSRMLAVGAISALTLRNRDAVCRVLLQQLGKETLVAALGPLQFGELMLWLRANWKGKSRVKAAVVNTRSIFNWALKNRHIKELPTYGDFVVPSLAEIRIDQNERRRVRGGLQFSAAEVQKVLGAAGPTMRAKVLLAMNCAYGNEDLANLRESHLDLAGGWAELPRGKTGILRRCPLWTETIAAIKTALAERPEVARAEDADLLFPVGAGRLVATFKALLRSLGLEREWLGFYSFRRTFQIVASDARDQQALDHIFGHADATMGGVYRQGVIRDQRLRDVADHVHAWLFGAA